MEFLPILHERITEKIEKLEKPGPKKEPTSAMPMKPIQNKTCPKCNHPLRPGAKFCMNCGEGFEQASIVCPNCSEPVEYEWKACPTCGLLLPYLCPGCGMEMELQWKACVYCGYKLTKR